MLQGEKPGAHQIAIRRSKIEQKLVWKKMLQSETGLTGLLSNGQVS